MNYIVSYFSKSENMLNNKEYMRLIHCFESYKISLRCHIRSIEFKRDYNIPISEEEEILLIQLKEHLKML